MSQERPLRVGIVGCGYAATDRHLPALRAIEDEVRVVALADSDAGALSRAADAWSVANRYSSAAELIAHADVDAVAVCTPADTHADIALAALEADKHVLVEKPLTLSLADADAVVERAATSEAKATVGFNLRHHRQIRRAQELVRSGALGTIRTIHTTFTDPLGGRPDVPPWRRRRGRGGGALLDKAVHHFDLWRFLLDAEVVEVHASIQSSPLADDEAVVAVGRLTNGVLATATATDVTRVRNELVISGDEAEAHVSLYRFDGLTVAGAGEIPGAVRSRVRTAASTLKELRGAFQARSLGGDFAAAYAEQWRRFAAAIRGEAIIETTVLDGREALAVALAAAEAAETGRSAHVERFERSKTKVEIT